MKYENLTLKKTQLDKLRPLDASLLKNLDEWFRVELTYTSNAIEGNTLTRAETALVVEKGLTVGGKSLVEHLEATNHASALDWVKQQIKRKPTDITVKDILKIHEVILKGIDDYNAGNFRNVPVRISGSAVILPNPIKVANLMKQFEIWLQTKQKIHPVEIATEAHYRLVTIHPFTDGNGRTARLLMNMILMMYGYPPAIIRKQDRLKYINSLEKAQLVNGEGDSKNNYYKIISKAVDRSLDIYLKAVKGEDDNIENNNDDKLLKIGELAKKVGETNSTIRHWTKAGLLEVSEITPSGYQMYSVEMIERIKKIKELKEKRFSLEEISGNL
ncbi:MAG: Fic family protein [Rickettsiales bacterium]|nr:Fic family protein [Rickettsiales bacterium]